MKVERALLSVTDKTGVVDLARGLAARGVEILSTGGTAKAIRDAGVPVVPLEDFTGFPEMLDGRVKTLHPKVHGAILGRRDLESHRDQMAAHGIPPIDLVVVNLYDFAGAVSRPDASFADVVEQIDIGGPTMLRSAAKNHASVMVVVDPDDYPRVLEVVEKGEEPGEAFRRNLALKVFEHTTRYDAAISTWLAGQVGDPPDTPPAQVSRVYRRVEALRYGENPHQSAAFYRDAHGAPSFLAAAEKVQGKALSYNNLLDLDAALGLAIDLGAIRDDVSCVYIKHNNPCGAASASSVAEAIARAREVDSLSAFGAVVAVNRPLDKAAAEVFTETFVEAIIAPGYDEDALEVMAKKKNLRVLSLPDLAAWQIPTATRYELRQVRGGALLQSADSTPRFPDEIGKAQTVTTRAATDEERRGLAYAWTVAKHVRSNAIVFAREDRVVAVGAGQMSRVDSVKICRLKAGEALAGSVVASDAFFPFRDGVDVLAEAGALAIVQPGGSIRDEEVIQAANEHQVAMMFTGVRHFRH
ncbi:MAG: bifunctional phosphoribosylaminoimidazolecarboxamide formyltransferase/IMP cyclohydrolase [Myxococcales bacterium]|nr:bifunctional phosphoribosylaminoimidazolecarboxamide formyltransferase/IMP cyclohydrolase [Myxococcales bacterium]